MGLNNIAPGAGTMLQWAWLVIVVPIFVVGALAGYEVNGRANKDTGEKWAPNCVNSKYSGELRSVHI